MDGSHHELSGNVRFPVWQTGRGLKTPAGRAMPTWRRAVLLVAGSLCACSADRRSAEPDTLEAPADSARGTVASDDTVLSVEDALRKFRERFPQPSGLSNAARGREELAERFISALAARDTSALASLHITAAEFAWLYYPENPISRPPYSLPAGIAWFELQGNSETGLRRALREYGGRGLVYRALVCPRPPLRYGDNILWNECVVRVADENGVESRLRLFSIIVERSGRFKIASAANDL
jgi:hypothetical protein